MSQTNTTEQNEISAFDHLTQADALTRLWQSSAGLYRRFSMPAPDTKAQLRVFAEEAYEFTEATLCPEGFGENVVEEGVDVIVTLMGVLMSRGVALYTLTQAMERVAQKNDSKTHETHHINSNGKIARRGK